jgi:dipeptidyl aminopeptidase/acylaminoacyl peptidase
MDDWPAVIPGTTKLVVLSDRSGVNRLWLVNVGSSEAPRQIATGEVQPGPPAVTGDGRWVAYGATQGGIYVVPIDGSSPPRKLTTGEADTFPTFSRDGTEVYFETRTADGRPRIAVVPFAGGEPAALLDPGSATPSASSAADVLAYVALDEDGGDTGVPMLFDVHTRLSRAITTKVTAHRNSLIRLSPNGKRATIGEATGITEVDLHSGAVVSRFSSGADQLTGLAYVGTEILTSRHAWAGDLWTASDPFH